MREGQIQRWATVVGNLRKVGRELPHTVREWLARVHEWRPEVVITDFEPLAALYARHAHDAADRASTTSTCSIAVATTREIIGAEREDFRIAKAVTRSMVGGANEYVVTTFFRPPSRGSGRRWCRRSSAPRSRRRPPSAATTWSSTRAATRCCSTRCARAACPAASTGCAVGPRPTRRTGTSSFARARTTASSRTCEPARGVVAGGGFSLLSEAVYLGKPVLAIPLRGQFEQLMNARYLQREGFGLCAERVDDETRAGVPRRPRRVRGGARRLRAGRQRVHPGDDRAARPRGRRRGCARVASRAAAGAEAGMKRALGAGAAARRGRRLLPCAMAHLAGLRGDDLPRSGGPQADRAHLRRRAEPRAHPGADRPPRAFRRQGHLLLDRALGRARAGPAARGERRRPRDRQPHLHPSDDAAALERRGQRRAGPLPGRGRGRRGSSSRPVDGEMLMRPPYGRRRPGRCGRCAPTGTCRSPGRSPVTTGAARRPAARSAGEPPGRGRAT